MSNLDTRKSGGGQTVSYATVRLESEHLLPEQLLDVLAEMVADHADIDLQVQRQGTGPGAR
jgi:hypothetical protein